MRCIVAAAGVVAISLTTATALANPRALPFTYPYETLAKGEAEVEQYTDLTIVRALTTSGAPASLALFLLQTEFEYGITDRLELGLYVQVAPPASAQFNSAPALDVGNAIKQRLRYRLGDSGQLPIDFSFYGEIVESEQLIELEAKVNLQRRFGNLRIMANLSAEYEFYFNGRKELELNPTLGVTYQILPWLHTGIESWMRAEFETPPEGTRAFNMGPHVFVGPAVMFNWGKVWWSTGGYFRVTDVTRPINPTLNDHDIYGHFWARTVIGISL